MKNVVVFEIIVFSKEEIIVVKQTPQTSLNNHNVPIISPIQVTSHGSITTETPNGEDTLPTSGRTPKQVYSSSKKISFPIRVHSTQLVDDLQNNNITNGRKNISTNQDSPYITEESKTPFTNSDEKYVEQTKVFLPVAQTTPSKPTPNRKTRQKYLVTGKSSTEQKKKKKWRCCIM